MSYRLRADEPVPEGVRRVVQEQLARAVVSLHPDGRDVDEAVHQVRKRTKKVRAVLRLVREPLGGAYRRENAAARDAARSLGEVRDLAVLAGTLDRVLDDAVGVRREPYADLVDELHRRHREARAALEAGPVLADVAATLTALGERTTSWPLDDDGWDLLAPGFDRVYRRGRTALDHAIDDGAPEDLHEWRKRTKYHRHHLELLRPVWPTVLEARAGAADRLGDVLGESHDLSELRRTLDDPDLGVTDGALDTLVSLVEHRRRELDHQAVALGRLLFAEKPKRLRRRLGRYWEIARDGA